MGVLVLVSFESDTSHDVRNVLVNLENARRSSLPLVLCSWFSLFSTKRAVSMSLISNLLAFFRIQVYFLKLLIVNYNKNSFLILLNRKYHSVSTKIFPFALKIVDFTFIKRAYLWEGTLLGHGIGLIRCSDVVHIKKKKKVKINFFFNLKSLSLCAVTYINI